MDWYNVSSPDRQGVLCVTYLSGTYGIWTVLADQTSSKAINLTNFAANMYRKNVIFFVFNTIHVNMYLGNVWFFVFNQACANCVNVLFRDVFSAQIRGDLCEYVSEECVFCSQPSKCTKVIGMCQSCSMCEKCVHMLHRDVWIHLFSAQHMCTFLEDMFAEYLCFQPNTCANCMDICI